MLKETFTKRQRRPTCKLLFFPEFLKCCIGYYRTDKVLCLAEERELTFLKTKTIYGLQVIHPLHACPLYMTHYAAIWVFGNYFTSRKPPAAELAFIIIAGTILLVLIVYLVMKLYDNPVRRYLSKKRKQERKRSPHQS
ncbi:MAG TPA: hypothetical protein VGN63_12275 [Flavisolibacter sp.]|jgi:hypothetical protein|nr:hypothetical protein [Flavisolibacter sp.]